MKHALIITTISGFVPQFEMNDVRILQENGYTVHYASDFENPIYNIDQTQLKRDGLILHHIDIRKSPFQITKNTKAFLQLKQIIRKEQISLVHCHNPMGGVVGRLAAKASGREPYVVYTAHGFHFYEGAPKKNWLLYYTAERFLAAFTDRIITINREDYERANRFRLKEYGCVEQIPGVGVNIEKFRKKPELREIKRKELEELERISKYTKEQARDAVMKMVETKMSKEIAAYIKEMESEAKLEVDERAKELLVGTMQKYAADITSEQTVSVIALPNDEMKGRLIGREGRNIRTIESVTGVDLIIDDTPEAIVISSFDPLRREIARLTLETLIKDGRIHPARIEELYAKTCADVKQTIKEFGKNALYELGLSKMDPELVEIVGKLHFRSSYGQNALTHSMEVANLAGIMASELGENVNLAKRAGLLHDIGKAIDFEMEGSHVKIGVDLAKKYGEDEVVINAIASHHGEVPPTSIISSIVAIADAVSASRPGARNDSSENYVQRLEQLEEIGNKMQGVEKAYAIQAGRELRVMVKPDEVDDLTAHQIAREIKEKIENELKYPGTIKVTVIRETRAQEEAK